MKKFTIALLALVLVCSSVFAATSVTGGLGFGGFMVPQKLDELGYLYNAGPAAFVGFDYVNNNGLTIYDDLAFNLTMIDNGHKGNDLIVKNFITATDYAGVGYTFDVSNFTVMAGAGVEAKLVVSGMVEALAVAKGCSAEDLKDAVASHKAMFATVGAGVRCKASYALKDNLAVSFQLNGSFDFKSFMLMDGESVTDADAFKFASANALVGVTYKF